MKHFFLYRLLTAVCFFGMLAVAPGAWAQNPTPGNLIVLQAASASANNTTAAFVEISPSTSQPNPVQTVSISGTGANAIRISGSATSTGYLSRTNDGSLVTLTGANSTNTTANANTLNPRAVVTLDAGGSVSIATTYTGVSGQQTRSATSLNNTNWSIADQNGLYTNGSTSASPGGNFRGIKAFGGTVYVSQASSTTTAIQVSTVSAPSGGTITGLPGLTNNVNTQDFYLIQSGNSGSSYDVLYVLYATSNTAGTIAKFSLSGGSWVANGTFTTTFGGFGLAAQRSGSGTNLYVTTGQGALAANSVLKLTDAAGYNSPINITAANNLTLFTTAAGTTLKGIDFAPAAACPAITASLTGTSTICAGSSANLTATITGGTGPYSLTYANGTSTSVVSGTTITVSPTASTTYTIAGITDANGCSGTASGTVVVTVNPQLSVSNAGPAQTITVGSSATLAANAPTSGTGSWSVASGPSTSSAQFSSLTDPGATFTPAGGSGNYVLTWTISNPPCAASGSSLTITVGAANQPPVAPTLANQTGTVAVPFSYTVPAFTDPENQTLTYAATGVPAPLTFDPVTRVISGTPAAASVSVITITATDPASNTVSTTFSLTVNAAPMAPASLIRITEYMYSSNNGSGNGVGEFVELTNVGNAPIDLTGWSFDDNSRTPGSFTGVSTLGVVQPNESVIITDAPAAQFRTFWYLPASVKVAGGNDQNLGRSDEINIYDATNTLVTRMTYNDQGTNPANTVRTQAVSAWPQRNLLGQMNSAGWQLSVAGDAQNSYLATTGDLGNPGGYFIPLPRIKVVETGGTTTVAEGGATDTYTVALNSPPTANVTVTINSTPRLTVSPTTLTFTPANYSAVQTVTVTATDDAVYQGAPQSVTITQTVASSDLAYNSLPVNPVSVTVTDNDVAATAPPTIQVANITTPYLSLPATGQGYVSGVIGDPTDPASTLGINFTLADTDTPVASLTVTVGSNNTAVVPAANLAFTGTGASRTLKITPAGVGYATITVSVSDGANTASYIVNYAASAASATQNITATRFHTGTSDASTAVLVDASYTLVGDDENQVLRLYNRQNSGLPVAGFDYTSMLGLTDVSGGVPREVDLEASIRQTNRIFWFGSESNADGGAARPNRDRVFATDLSGSGAATTLTYVGRYDYLKEDIINWDVTNAHGKGAGYYGLQASAAANVGSKQPSGFNSEGAEFAPDNSTVFLGFRAPQVVPANRTKALIVPVTNLTSLISSQAQGSATFGAPIELDLGGRGIREIRKNTSNEYVIVAGPAGDAGAAPNDFRLYTWTGNAADAPVLRTADLTSLNANGSFESIVDVPTPLTNTTQLQLLVDNGDAVYYNDGTIAKELTQNNFKKFRSDLVTLGSPVNTAPVASANASQTATVRQAFTYTVNAFSDAETPNNLTYTASINPANGLNFDPATRLISGTPSMSGVSTVTVTATDPGSLSASTTFSITVNPATVVVTSLSLTASANPTTLLTTGTTTLSAMVSGGTSPYSYSFTGPGTINASGNTASVSNLPAGVQTFTVVARDATSPTSQTLSATVSVTVSAPAPTGPATLTITSFSCFSTNGALSRVNFVVGYSDGTFTPALPPLFINGTTAAGQLGQPYSFGFDANAAPLPIQDNASRSTYFVWNYRAACAGGVTTPPTPVAPVAPALANQMATQGSLFSYAVPAFAGTTPIAYSATGLPAGLGFDPATRLISGTPSTTGVSTVVVSASNAAGQSSAQFTLTVSASATQPTGPATLTITSFSCFSTNGALSRVNFVVGYSDGTFAPALPPLFINGTTAAGQLGQQYSFGFDANAAPLPIQDNASRSTYFVWDYRAACTARAGGVRLSAEPVAPLQVRVLGNPVNEVLMVEVSGVAGQTLTIQVVESTGRVLEQRVIEQATGTEVQRFDVYQQSTGVLLLRATAGEQTQTVKVLKK